MFRIARRTALTLSAIILATTLFAPNALAASIKAGGSCKTKGLTQVSNGKKFTCISKGKKLIWDSGITVKTAKPSATASPTTTPAPDLKFEPWASKFDYTLMVNAALQKTAAYFGSIVPNSNYQEIVDPKFKAEDKTQVNSVLNYVNGAFSKFQLKPNLVFLGTAHQWAADTLRANNTWLGDPRSQYPCSDGSRDAMCAEGSKILLVYSDIYGGLGTFGWDYGRVSVPAHEYFHTVQAQLSSENGIGNLNVKPTPETLPVWLDEGSANFVGFFMTHQMKLVDYFYARNFQITNNQSYKEIHPLDEYIGRGNTPDGKYYLDPYGIGQAATEYIVASVGFKALIDIYINYKTSKNFPVAFKDAVGIDIKDFYSKFEVARSSMKLSK